jgi:hypothetical protein
MMKEKLNQIDAILNELQMDEYLNEDSLPKIGKAREIVQQLVKNCNAPAVVKSVCEHPREHRSYIGRNTLKCGICGLEFE